MAEVPDYYAVLEVTPTATSDQIRQAYKKAALKWHPDRVSADSPERSRRTKKFQEINDAYYTLSSAERRRDYDDARKWHGTTPHYDSEAEEEVPRPPPQTGGASWANMFGFGRPAGDAQGEQFANDQFQGAFEEMMKEEELADGNNQPTKRFWTIIGSVAGGALGFIVGNVVGMGVGAAAGGKAGAIRDAKGKSVYEVFQSLDQGSRAKVLSELAARIFAGAIS